MLFQLQRKTHVWCQRTAQRSVVSVLEYLGFHMLFQDLRKWRTLKIAHERWSGTFPQYFTVPKSQLEQPKAETLPFLGEAWKSQFLRDTLTGLSLGTEVMKTCLILVSDSSDLAKAYWELLDTPTKYQLPIHLTCHKDLWTLLPASSHCKGACASACTLSSPSSSSLNKFAARNDQHTNPFGVLCSSRVATNASICCEILAKSKMDLGRCILASYRI